MELRVLKYFLMIAREENITRAAQLLHVTQPTLSRQIRELEDELGAKLFERSNHHIMLTPDGLLLRRRAQEIVELAERTELDFKGRGAQIVGEIAIGSAETLSMGVLAGIMTGLREQHPGITYRLYSGSADQIKERIESGTLDVGLLGEPVDIARYAFFRLPTREQWGVLTREDSTIAGLEAVRAGDLAGRALMIPERALVKSELHNWLGEHNGVFLHYNLLNNVARLVQSGAGEALCLRIGCKYPGLRFIPLEPPLTFGSVLVWKKHQIASPAVGALIEHARTCLAGMNGD